MNVPIQNSKNSNGGSTLSGGHSLSSSSNSFNKSNNSISSMIFLNCIS